MIPKPSKSMKTMKKMMRRAPVGGVVSAFVTPSAIAMVYNEIAALKPEIRSPKSE